MSQNDDTESFAAMFEKQAAPKAKRDFRPGDRIRGVVVQVGKDAIFVELDGKVQAFLEREEVAAPDGSITVKVGDTLEAHIVSVDEERGEIRIGKNAQRGGGVEAMMQAKESRLPVEGKVTGTNKGGIEVDLGGGTRAFCPNSQVDAKAGSDPAAYVGQTLKFLVTEVKDGGKSIVLSRRALLAREMSEQAGNILATLTPGTVVRGTVTGLREFGAFVDLGGVEGLIPKSEIAYDRGVSVQDALKAGDVVEVLIREIKDDPKSRDGQKRITLSLKALMDDPWQTFDLALHSVVQGTVARVADFGAFVRIAPGIDGLLGNGDMAGGKEAKATLEVGSSIAVVIDAIDKTERKIRLVPAPAGAAVGARVAKQALAVGSIVKGKVERIETYGVFVQVEGTSGRGGRGLVPVAELGVQRGVDLRKTFPEGTELTCKVLETSDGKLKLSVRGAKSDEERAQFEDARAKNKVPQSLGTLGDLLAKMKR